MNDDRHGTSCAREVSARVDDKGKKDSCSAAKECAASHEHSGQAIVAPAPKKAPQLSKRLAETRAFANQLLTSDWSVFRARLLRAFFRDAAPLALRYRVNGEDVVAHAERIYAPKIERGQLLRPVACVADLAVASACCLGRANAWNELWVFAEPSMTRAAFARLPDTLALTWTRRYWTRLEAETTEQGAGLAGYDGSRPIRLWLVEELMGAIERERESGALEIRREQLGRPIPLRLVGEQLA